ncbi:PREDICTED: putative inorganic phosphate cotransporter isoform X3 [Polistes canadensis]|uniref:putative inorganic phosphate cotransporter isoform X3 n=1 Tax=Polistes canadensis TaxID=91411 RepID=UPI0007190723|nr:PREDICTED: putative inorganic phosphate cotransporter isoform X3 [Polistes canadensis]XP_014602941.1 PREDICTED: putative inorganic phosphate cotransporter isoform X3 [Polistes canadensis]
MSGSRANGNESGGRRNGHVLVWEQPGLEENDKPVRRRKGCWGWLTGLLGTRHVVTFMLFLGMANAYVMRTNMSVAIVAMVNHTAITGDKEFVTNECHIDDDNKNTTILINHKDGEFAWDTKEQGYLLSSFFYGYVLTQIPFGMLAKRFGSKYFLGIGMLINSIFGLLVPLSAHQGFYSLMVVRFIQGLGEGPIVPCTHALLAKWIPPNERSRMGAFVYAGAQFGTVISMPLSGLLSEYGFSGGWPSIFYVFGAVGIIWCIAFFFLVYEDPENHPRISEDEKKYIVSALWGNAGASSPPIPWKSIATSKPFWAILIAHMGQNYGYETLMTELPTFMKQILHFDIKSNGLVSSLPYLNMWVFSLILSQAADKMISLEKCSLTSTRKIVNSIGQYGPAIALVAASYTGCNPWLTIVILTIGVGFNGGIYSGFKVNHLDISPRFAGVLMAFTNCLANLAGLLAPIVAGHIIVGTPTHLKWRIVFMISAAIYVVCATFYLMFGSGERQPWDNPEKDEEKEESKELDSVKTVNETQH